MRPPKPWAVVWDFLFQDLRKVGIRYVPEIYGNYRRQGFGRFWSGVMAFAGWS